MYGNLTAIHYCLVSNALFTVLRSQWVLPVLPLGWLLRVYVSAYVVMFMADLAVVSIYRLYAEAKGSTGFRILKTHVKSRGRQPEGFMTRLKNSKTVDPIGCSV